MIPFSSVTNAEIDEIELGIVRQALPNRAAAAALPPLPLPGLGRLNQYGIFRFLRWIAGYCVKAPHELSCFRIVRGDITPHAVLRTAVADHDPAFDHTGRLRNGVGFGWINGQSAPHFLARPGIYCHHPPVNYADLDIDFPVG